MKTLLVILAVIAAGMLWIRFSPIDRDRWHIDPAEAEGPEDSGIRLIGLQAPRYPADTDTVLITMSEIALDEPRTKVLDGDIEEGMITFVTRSRVFGFADFTTVKAVSEGAVTKLSIISRSQVGTRGNDWGVNAAKVDRWLQEMRLRLGE